MSTYGSNPNPLGLPEEGGRTGYLGTPTAPRVSSAPAEVSGRPTQAQDNFNGPGMVDFDLTDPQGSVDKAASETGDMWSGLKSFLFGTNQGDITGKHGGLLNIGDVPLVGDALRGGADVVGSVGGAVLGAVMPTVGGALERVPADSAKALGLQEQFDALPDDSVAKKAALEQMGKDQGLFGTGVLSGKEHYMSLAIQQHEEEVVAAHPSLWQGSFRPAASMADVVSNMFGVLGAPVRQVERLVAGAGRAGEDGKNQLQMIRAVGDGNAVWNSDDPGLTAVEQVAYDKITSGEWGDDDALNYLASHGAGFAHNKALEIAANIAFDPVTDATLGAGAVTKLGETGLLLYRTLSDARAGLALAEKAHDAAKIEQFTKAVTVAEQGIKTGAAGEGVASRDILGQLAKRKWTGDVARRYGQFYGELEGTTIGKAAKITRTVIDPMHVIGANPRAAASVDEGSREVTQAVINAHGEFTHIDTIKTLRGLDGGDELARQYNEGMAIYSGNVWRRVAGRQFRGVQMMMSNGADRLANTLPFESIKAAVGGMKRKGLVQLEEEAGKYVHSVWSADDDENLAARASALWGGMEPEDWKPVIADMSGQQKSLLHAATYGSAVKQLHEAREIVRRSGQLGMFADRLDQLVLLNRRTLTDLGAQGILDQIKTAGDLEAKMSVIEAARTTYPELRSYLVDNTSKGETLENFLEMLERRKNYLPAQIREAERADLPAALKDFDARITPSSDPTKATFTIGFRPKDEFLWGLEEDSEGVMREVHDPWLDQVSDNLQEYAPVREVPYNIAGMPIVGPAAEKAASLLDYTEAAGRMAMHGVTGRMVSQAAHIKFAENVGAKYGMNKGEVENIWSALMKKVDDSKNISGMRGLSEGAIWDAAKAVIPKSAELAGLGRRELLVHVLEAYDGDLRYIGLTQKLSGKAKLALGKTFLGNTAGEISEHAWPLLKFRLNPFFQLQEKIEPWVLSAQRGASIALGRKMNDIDRVTADVYRNFADKGLINIADNDIAELSAKYVLGSRLESDAVQEGGRFNAITKHFEGLADVQGTKQLAMMRTFKKGLGAQMRAAWDEAMPGEFDRMLNETRAMRGEVISEDDFAVLNAHSNLAANAMPVNMIDGKPVLDFTNSILEGQWSAPQHLGEMRALNLDYMARRIALRDTTGKDLRTSMDIRRAFADGTLKQQDVSRALRQLGAHQDYISRVESAYDFSVPKFWKQAQETYSMTDGERRNLEGVFRRIASDRGMTPVEYMSQVWSPQIARGTDHAVGSLGNLVGAMRNGMPTADLGQLRGIAGQSGIDDFYQQAGAIMAHHLDPSAKRAFLEDIMGNEYTPDSVRDILDTWDQLGATDQMSQRVMRFMQGVPGSGAHDLVANEATGIASIRNLASEVRTNSGRPRNLQRFISHDAPAVESQLADALDLMPDSYTHVATADDLAKTVDMAEVERIARSRSLSYKDAIHTSPDEVKTAMDARVRETRSLYQRITTPRADGGLGIRVQRVNSLKPYASADAMRADLAAGKIKVPATGYYHPILMNEDLLMERAVSDVFGHGQEANALGSHDAIMNAAAMYSPQAQSSVLADGFARSAWEKSSQKVIPTAVAEPTSIEEYEARYGAAAPRVESMGTQGLGADDAIANRPQSRTIGLNVRAAAPDVQKEAISTLGVIRNQFPGVELPAFDFGNIPADGVTLSYELEHPTIVLNTESGWQSDAVIRDETRARRLRNARNSASDTSVRNRVTGAMEPRKSEVGAPMFTSATPTGDMWHEFGHVVDIMLHNRAKIKGVANYGSRRMTGFMRGFKGSEAQRTLSEYAFNASDETHLTDSDMVAELFDFSFNPENSQQVEDAFGTPLGDAVNEFRSILKDEGVWHPDGSPVPVNPHAGMTVADANAAGAGIRAPFKAGLLPQEVHNNVVEHFIGNGRYAESNPDVGRLAAYLHHHMANHVGEAFENGTAGEKANLLNMASGMPVTDAVPYDLTQAVMWHGAAQMMAAKWNDAFRLQYFAQERSMLQRSINHPMFGLYPASYMWGKIGPEMVRFIAHEPFGMKTGALGYSLADIQKAVAVQRQYDPKFDKGINDLGHSAALSFLGYMLPATPWDVPASYPAWLRNMAQQGLENEARANAHLGVRDDNFVTPFTDTLKKIFPMQTQLPFADRALGEVGNALPWNAKAPEPTSTFNPSGVMPLPNQPTPAPAEPAPATPTTPPTTGSLAAPVPAMDLTAVLGPEMRSLTDMLSGA